MPCLKMRELQASCEKYSERRHTATGPERERRKGPIGSRRLGQFRVSYLIQDHRMNCEVCLLDSVHTSGNLM
jgi:hypothetical protein